MGSRLGNVGPRCTDFPLVRPSSTDSGLTTTEESASVFLIEGTATGEPTPTRGRQTTPAVSMTLDDTFTVSVPTTRGMTAEDVALKLGSKVPSAYQSMIVTPNPPGPTLSIVHLYCAQATP